jgi:hypothetical protein
LADEYSEFIGIRQFATLVVTDRMCASVFPVVNGGFDLDQSIRKNQKKHVICIRLVARAAPVLHPSPVAQGRIKTEPIVGGACCSSKLARCHWPSAISRLALDLPQ